MLDSNYVQNPSGNQTELNQLSGDSGAKIGTIYSQFSDLIHSLDSANACGALGP